jgi:Fur family ferric uptake transcriptional regulator
MLRLLPAVVNRAKERDRLAHFTMAEIKLDRNRAGILLKLIINKEQIMQAHQKVFSNLLARKGLKLTKTRRQILEAVFSLHEHFDVEGLYEHARKAGLDISRPTIYRTLPLLLEAGLIQYSPRSSSRDVYEHIFGHAPHIHWVCEKCGAVLETSLDRILPQLKRSAEVMRFGMGEVQVRVNGVCWKCQKTDN